MKSVTIGDRVRYASAFLRNTGQVTGDVPFMRGRVIGVKKLSSDGPVLVEIQWDSGETGRVIAPNLEACR